MVRKKRVYLEFLRIISAMLVIFNHIPGYTLYQTTSGSSQWFYMFLTMFTRANVPIFFMISGSLLLDREQETYKAIFKKRISRTVAVLLIFEVLMMLFGGLNAYLNGDVVDISVKSFILQFLAGNMSGTGAWWYLYAYLGLLLCLPFMRRIARELNKYDCIMLIAVHFVFSTLIPMANMVLSYRGSRLVTVYSGFSVPFATSRAFFYPLIGYYIDRKIDITGFRKKHLIGLSLMMVAGILLQCLCTKIEGLVTGQYTQNQVYLFDYVTAIAVFILVKYLFEVKLQSPSNEKWFNVICKVGSLTFGIYILEPFMRKAAFYRIYDPMCAAIGMPVLIRSFMWCFLSVVLGGAITCLLKKMPVFRKLL